MQTNWDSNNTQTHSITEKHTLINGKGKHIHTLTQSFIAYSEEDDDEMKQQPQQDSLKQTNYQFILITKQFCSRSFNTNTHNSFSDSHLESKPLQKH